MRLWLGVFATSGVLHAQVKSGPLVRSDSQRVIVLRNGVNAVDILGDGTSAQVFVAWRSNNNAHGSSMVTFNVFAKSDVDNPAGIWQVVPFFGGPHDGDSGQETYRTAEGADCTQGDLRVVRQGRGPVEVVTAVRELGASFADPAPVRFDYYALVKNVDETPGWPTFYFKHVRTASAKKPYCDVNEAFARELGLGAKGLGHGEGGR
jgi:hypothetical protein